MMEHGVTQTRMYHTMRRHLPHGGLVFKNYLPCSSECQQNRRIQNLFRIDRISVHGVDENVDISLKISQGSLCSCVYACLVLKKGNVLHIVHSFISLFPLN